MASKRTLLMRLTVVLVLIALLVPVFAACGIQSGNKPDDPANGSDGNKTEDPNGGKTDDPLSYTITFHLNGGTFPDGTSVPKSYHTGDTTVSLPVPTKGNVAFLGWYVKASADPEKDTKYTTLPTDKAENLDFYALWAGDYTITYHLNNGAFPSGTKIPTSYSTGDAAVALPIPKKENAEFLGWFDKENADPKTDTKYTTLPTDGAEDLEFFALWAEAGEYTITYHLNGGTFQTDVRTSFTTGDEPFAMPYPKRLGYTFQGWWDNPGFEDGGGDYYSKVPTDSMQPLEFWAEWKVSTYTLTLNANGGTLPGSDKITYTVEDGKIKLPTPTGATEFLGWYTSFNYVGEALKEWDALLAKDAQLYAKWAKVKNTITLNTNGGALDTASTIQYTNDKGVLTLPTPTLSGKYFVAWYTDEAFTSTPMWKFRSSLNKNITLYARWADTEAEAAAVRAGVIEAPADITVDAKNDVYVNVDSDTTVGLETKVTTLDGQYVARYDFSTENKRGFYYNTAETFNSNLIFTDYNTIEFSIYSEKATGAQFGIFFVPKGVNEGYAQIGITINWKGWKTFSVPYSALTGRAFLTTTEKPFTWAWVSNSGWGYGESAQPETVVYMTSIRLVKNASKLNLDFTVKDLDKVKDNIRKEMIGDATLNSNLGAVTNLGIADASTIQGWIDSLNTSSTTQCWTDLTSPVNGGNSNGQYCANYFERIYKMAQAYAAGKCKTQSNINAINKALDWMYKYAYNTTTKAVGNWWYWEIGAALPLIRTLLLVENDMNTTTKANCLKALERFVALPKYTYANRSWTGYTALYAAILRKDTDQVKKCMEELLQCFEYATMNSDRDGFFEDGSFIQHKYTPYITGYGGNYLSEMTSIIYSLQGTALALDQTYVDRFFSFFFNSYAPMMYQGNVFAGCFGRGGLGGYDPNKVGCTWMAYILKIAHLANEQDQARLNSLMACIFTANPKYGVAPYLNPPAYANYVAFKKAFEAGEIEANEELGAYMMTASDRVIQKTETYAALVAMSSTRIYRYEAINGQNGWGWYLGDGVLYVAAKSHPDTYNSYFKYLKNTQLLPGITTTDAERIAKVYDVDSNPFGAYSVVGGVSNDAAHPLYSMAYMHFGADQKAESYKNGVEDLDVKKVWFFFDNEIVCLGSGITSTTNSNIFTIMDNRYIGNDSCQVYSDQRKLTPVSTTTAFTGVKWLYFNQFGGYYFPNKTDVDMTRGASSEEGFVRFTLNHGVKPTDMTYAYVMLPGMSKANVSKYDTDPDIEVLSNTAYISAAREKKLGMTGIAFWESNQKFTVGDVAMTAADPCAVMLTENSDQTYTFSISEPTQLLTNLTVTLDGVWNVSANENMTVKTVNGNTVITVNTSGALGATFTCTISK